MVRAPGSTNHQSRPPALGVDIVATKRAASGLMRVWAQSERLILHAAWTSRQIQPLIVSDDGDVMEDPVLLILTCRPKNQAQVGSPQASLGQLLLEYMGLTGGSWH